LSLAAHWGLGCCLPHLFPHQPDLTSMSAGHLGHHPPLLDTSPPCGQIKGGWTLSGQTSPLGLSTCKPDRAQLAPTACSPLGAPHLCDPWGEEPWVPPPPAPQPKPAMPQAVLPSWHLMGAADSWRVLVCPKPPRAIPGLSTLCQ
jgi:hypothetical protein